MNYSSHIEGFRGEISKVLDQGEDEFIAWFNNDYDSRTAIMWGKWDFAYHIASLISEYVPNPEQSRALEIGCGGGRLLSASAHYFGEVVGIDVHNELHRVQEQLRGRGIVNVELRQTDGSSIPCDDASFDVVYTFVVLQHVEYIETFRKYFAEIARVLNLGGVAMCYVGRFHKFSAHRPASYLRLAIDRIAELVIMPKGYRDRILTGVGGTNLQVTLPFVRKLAAESGLKLVRWNVSRKQVPHRVREYGGQYGLLLKKVS